MWLDSAGQVLSLTDFQLHFWFQVCARSGTDKKGGEISNFENTVFTQKEKNTQAICLLVSFHLQSADIGKQFCTMYSDICKKGFRCTQTYVRKDCVRTETSQIGSKIQPKSDILSVNGCLSGTMLLSYFYLIKRQHNSLKKEFCKMGWFMSKLLIMGALNQVDVQSIWIYWHVNWEFISDSGWISKVAFQLNLVTGELSQI